MSNTRRWTWVIGAGLGGAAFLLAVYLSLVSLAESPQHAVDLLWADRWIVGPIILGFGVQSALYMTLKKRLFMPCASTGPTGVMTGMSGATSTAAMVACCAHHVTDVLPVLGLTAATAFLAEYRLAFMRVGLGTTLLGIAVMSFILLRERRRSVRLMSLSVEGV